MRCGENLVDSRQYTAAVDFFTEAEQSTCTALDAARDANDMVSFDMLRMCALQFHAHRLLCLELAFSDRGLEHLERLMERDFEDIASVFFSVSQISSEYLKTMRMYSKFMAGLVQRRFSGSHRRTRQCRSL
jgi:hypothetical protein